MITYAAIFRHAGHLIRYTDAGALARLLLGYFRH